MAAVELPTTHAIPGLHVAPTTRDLQESALCWNSLPESLDQPDVPVQHLNELAALLARHGVQKLFTIHLIHRHDTIEAGKIMIGTSLKTLTGFWTRPTEVHTLNLTNVRGYIFKLTPEGLLQAYEYREGPLVDLSGVPSAFFSELIGYLQENQLVNLLGLEAIQTVEPLAEFDIGDNGTVMLKADQVKFAKAFKVTGFSYHEADDGVRQLKGNASVHSKLVNGDHKVFLDSKLRDEACLMKALRQKGILAE